MIVIKQGLFFFVRYHKPFCFCKKECRNVLWLSVEKDGFVVVVCDFNHWSLWQITKRSKCITKSVRKFLYSITSSVQHSVINCGKRPTFQTLNPLKGFIKPCGPYLPQLRIVSTWSKRRKKICENHCVYAACKDSGSHLVHICGPKMYLRPYNWRSKKCISGLAVQYCIWPRPRWLGLIICN